MSDPFIPRFPDGVLCQLISWISEYFGGIFYLRILRALRQTRVSVLFLPLRCLET